MAVEKNTYYEFFEYRLDLEKQQLFKNNEPVSLTHKAFQVLLLLVQNSGQTTKKEDIFNELWSDSFVEEGNLTQHIYVLRRALGRTPEGQPYIETVPRQGYRFTLLPEQISVGKIDPDGHEDAAGADGETPPPAFSERKFFSAKPAPRAVESATGSDARDTGAPFAATAAPGSPAGKSAAPELSSESGGGGYRFYNSPLRRLLISGLFLLGFALAAGAVYYFRRPPSPPPPMQHQTNISSDEAERIRSIAVLPFRPIGEEVDSEKFGLGMSDAVTARLSNLRQVAVRPTSSVFRFADRAPENAVQAGKELGVDSVLEGTVQFDAERVRVSVQLVRVRDGKTLWADSFQEEVSDIFALQDSISAKVASTLSLNLSEQQQQLLARRPTNSHEAYQSYQMGVYFWNRRKKEDLEKAVGHFQKAVDIDPAYAQAYAALADAYSMLAYYRYANIDEMKQKARAAAEKALSLDDSLAEAYIALGIVYAIRKENFGRAQELFERAVMLAPYSSIARHRYAWILLMNGRLDEGVREMRMARENDPLAPATNRAYCAVLIMQRNFEEALAECESRFEIYQGTPNSRRALARAYFYAGRPAEAIEQLEIQLKSGNSDEKFFARGSLAFFYTKMGRGSRGPEPERIYAELKKEFDRKEGFSRDPQQAGDLALVAFALGKKDEAAFYFAEMLKLLDEYADLALSLYYDPFWDDMKKDALFAPLFPKPPVPGAPPENPQTEPPAVPPGKVY